MSCAKSIQFADDINASITAKTLEELESKIILTLKEIELWCIKKRLILHPEKSSILQIHRRGTNVEPITCFIFNKKIQNVDSVRILGVTVQSDLQWDSHTEKLRSTLNSANFALLSIRNMVTLKNLMQVYYAYFFSSVSFGILFWGCDNKWLNSNFILQKRALRIMNNFPPDMSCRTQFKKMQMLTIPCIFIMACCVFRKQYPEFFSYNSDNHSYNTRNKDKVALPKHSTNILSKSTYYKCAILYDHLPKSLRNVKHLTFFRTLLKKFLVDMEYYDVQSFLGDTVADTCILKFVSKKDLLKYS